MPENPADPYEVLQVAANASAQELRRAYRARLRETHPDTGGSPEKFYALQNAWLLLSTTKARESYHRQGNHKTRESGTVYAPSSQRPRANSRPPARAYGHPGGWYRERYLEQLREWVGHGVKTPDPYDPSLLRSAPRSLRHLLADALAEEASARELANLGIGYTIWHDVATKHGKIDHVLLGASGLWALLSEDWGDQVSVKKGELVGEALQGERPVRTLYTRARALTKETKVRFSALGIITPNASAVIEIAPVRTIRALLIPSTQLLNTVRTGIAGHQIGGTEIFELRTRLQSTIRFV